MWTKYSEPVRIYMGGGTGIRHLHPGHLVVPGCRKVCKIDCFEPQKWMQFMYY